MKHLYLAAIFAALFLAGCKKSSNSPQPPVPEYVAMGKITVIDPQFEKDNIRLKASLVSDSTLTLSIDSVSFSEKMPLAISLQLAPVNYTREGDNIIFHTDNAVPTIGQQRYESYTVRNMQGIIRADSMKFTTLFGEYECEYGGKITDKHNTL